MNQIPVTFRLNLMSFAFGWRVMPDQFDIFLGPVQIIVGCGSSGYIVQDR